MPCFPYWENSCAGEAKWESDDGNGHCHLRDDVRIGQSKVKGIDLDIICDVLQRKSNNINGLAVLVFMPPLVPFLVVKRFLLFDPIPKLLRMVDDMNTVWDIPVLLNGLIGLRVATGEYMPICDEVTFLVLFDNKPGGNTQLLVSFGQNQIQTSDTEGIDGYRLLCWLNLHWRRVNDERLWLVCSRARSTERNGPSQDEQGKESCNTISHFSLRYPGRWPVLRASHIA